MITLPKPKFAETNVPTGISKDAYRDKIIDMQSHVLKDAIDRVSIRDIIYKYKLCTNKSTKLFQRFFYES